jgi:carbon monoxide dehydrogenase subunit G
MQLKGENRCLASAEVVYKAMLDPEQLSMALPGCQSLNVPEPGVYTGEVSMGVGAVKGTYTVTVKIVDQKPYSFLRLDSRGKGFTGQVAFTMELTLEEIEKEVTMVNWVVDAKISGLVASVGSRVISGVARFIADQFFSKLLSSEVQSASK